jgi:uncharacterized damage-inducible protein DinB
MITLHSAAGLFRYSDWANGRLLEAAGPIDHAALDRPFDMGPGSLRRTLLHLWAGESVWVQRWQGRTETPWPDEAERVEVGAIRERLAEVYRVRDGFVGGLSDADLRRAVCYRDSKGGRFTASLGDMMTQMIVHSIHHRAQAVNMLRRLEAGAPELDYMMWVRRPA